MATQHDDPETTLKRAKEKLRRDMGAEALAALEDPRTVELMINPDGRMWIEHLGSPMRCIGDMNPARTEAIIRTVAGYHGKEVHRLSPTLEGEFPLDGSRFAGQLSPVVQGPTLAIRKRAVAIYTLDDYTDQSIMTGEHKDAIRAAVAAHRNVLVTGGTGSGKTTLVNAIVAEMVKANPRERLVIIEDTGEIQCAAENAVLYHTTAEVSMTQLLRTTLRMRPDRILVGEVRGPEALDLLMAWNTGHEGGAATLHANSAQAGLTRLAMLISMNPDSPRPIEPLIGEAVHLIVHIERTSAGRRIPQVLRVEGFHSNTYQTTPL